MTIAQQLEQKGIEIGIEQGVEIGKLDLIRTMLKNGADLATLMKLTGLTEKELVKSQH